MKTINMNHGAGGRAMHDLVNSLIISRLKNGVLERLDDSAIMDNLPLNKISLTTDSYVVNPLFFPGGDIGRLCVCGTVNDLSTSGAKPYALTLAFIIEEGFHIETLDQILNSIQLTAREAGVRIVTGDTKVVEQGKGDGLYINTSGIGYIANDVNLSTYNALPGDDVIITGTMGDHEIAMMKARDLIPFDIDIISDAAPLNVQVQQLLEQTRTIHCIKDPTRGGVASALMEISQHSQCEILIEENKLPINSQVQAVCNLVGYDPLYLANEGKMIVVCPPESTACVTNAFGSSATVIGTIRSKEKKQVLLKNSFGGIRRLSMLETIQLPRIC